MENGELMARRGFRALALLWALAGVTVAVTGFRAPAGRTGEAVPLPTTAPRITASLVAGRLGPIAMAIYAVVRSLSARMVIREPRIPGLKSGVVGPAAQQAG